MSATVIRCRQTYVSKCYGRPVRPLRCLRWASTFSSETQSSPSARDHEEVSEAIPPGSLVTELLESVELSAEKTRGQGRKRVADRLGGKNFIEDYLGHLQTTQHDLKLEDIERYKPQTTADPKSSNFETAYNEVIDSLMKSFSQPQLRQFLELYGVPPPPHRSNKRALATKILEEKWGWPSLQKVSQDRIDWSEVSERQFYLDPAQSFLLMGKDGADLLALSERFNVSLSFTANPMSLKVAGLKGALKQVEAHLETLKKDIDFVVVPLPFGKKLGSEIEQTISRLSGAYIRTRDDNKLSISFLKSQPQMLSVARRLIMQVATEKASTIEQALFLPDTLISSQPATLHYSLFPFSPQQPLPWHVPQASTFRYRRVGTWADAAHPHRSDRPVPLVLDNMAAYPSTRIGLKNYLTEVFSNRPNGTQSSSLSACFGQILFLSPSVQRATLVPPLVGPTDAAAVLQWAAEHPDHIIFNPSIPKIASSVSAHKQQYFQRLSYRADHSVDSGDRFDTLTIEIPQPDPTQTSLSNNQRVPGNETEGTSSHLDAISCFASSEKSINVLIPIRRVLDKNFRPFLLTGYRDAPSQTDLRFVALKSQSIPVSDLAENLRVFLNRAQSPDSAYELPLTSVHLGVDYYLRTSTYVRRQHKEVNAGNAQIDLLIETVFHPESGKITTHCKVTTNDYNSTSGWKNFLRACEILLQPHEVEHLKSPETFNPFES